MRLAVTKRKSSSAGAGSPRSHEGHNCRVMAMWGRLVHFLERRDTIKNKGYGTTGLRDTVKRGSTLLPGNNVGASPETIVVGKKGALSCDATHRSGSGPSLAFFS
jgi:hypothetical protein